MRAVQCIDRGPPVRLAADDIPRPKLPERHLRVAVHYCGLGIPDLLIMTGKYQIRPQLPFVPGSEVSGVVTEVGPGVERFHVGARVAGLNYTFVGGLAEEIVMPAAAAVVLPPSLSMRSAAGMLLNYATSNYALKDRGRLRAGERVLVLGAAGGVGLAAIEIAKAQGAWVLAAASSEAKLALARLHGADEGLNYAGASIKDELKRRGGFDVVVDPVGGVYSEQALRALRPGGRLLVIGFAAGEIPRIALNLPLLKDCSIIGAFLMTQMRCDPARFVANVRGVFALHAQGRLAPAITELDCFGDYGTALQRIGDRHAVGKVVLRVARQAEERRTDALRSVSADDSTVEAYEHALF
ncbi:MAG TPA: NADPH:quinone oxidoreductase family protein [Gammaproteobacteria bacterium]|nr:NADPH:quinone oxidoreductase family protein [Gammaproteobacteria bacterium]